jgi:myo-inositol 2-dehydrogenase / D-chiro-inositol 1-dehydrogenase
VNTFRVGIVGAGWIAADHLAALRKRDDVAVVAICDLDRSRAEQLAPDGANVYERWQDVLDDEQPDALWVCTPPLAHREPTLAALERGIHVYLEKPVARTPEDARAIVAAAEAADAVCAVGYQWHATEVLDDVTRALDGQEISLLVGRSIGPTGPRPWFLDQAQGGGNILERGSHQIDLIRAIAGDVEAVQATASSVILGQRDGERGNIADAATLVLDLAAGGVATIVVAWTREGQPRTYTLDVVASDATLALTLDPEFSLHGISRGNEIDTRSAQHPFERSIDRFLEAARAGEKSHVFCTPADAERTLAVARACEEALASGRTIAVA